MEIENWDSLEIKDGKDTQADNYESEKNTLSRNLRGANNVSLIFESGSESHSLSGLESGAERDSEKNLISDSESVIIVMIVVMAKAGFKGRFHILREIIMRKKALNFINRVRRSNNLQYLVQGQQPRHYNCVITTPYSQSIKL